MKSTKEGKAKWRGELASNSEASVGYLQDLSHLNGPDPFLSMQVKADRGEVESDDKSFDEMQRRTKDLPNREGPVNKTQ